MRNIKYEKNSLIEDIQGSLDNHEIIVYSKDSCPYCVELNNVFNTLKIEHKVLKIQSEDDWKMLQEETGQDFVPQVRLDGEMVNPDDYNTIKELASIVATKLTGKVIRLVD